MTGSGRKVIDAVVPDPSPSPIVSEEVIAAKGKVKRQAARRGRGANIFAGRMMAGRRDILNTRFNTKLGEI